MKPKFKKRDNVKIVCNTIEPKYVGRIGKISKVYSAFTALGEYCYVYRVSVGGRLLKGVANDDDLEPVELDSNGKEKQHK